MSNTILFKKSDEPKLELLRRHGWFVKVAHGQYCVVWRGSEEVLMIWRDGQWERASGGQLRDAA